MPEPTLVFHTRYDALVFTDPDPETCCKGKCEGTGWVPVRDEGSTFRFTICSRCRGAGKEPRPPLLPLWQRRWK